MDIIVSKVTKIEKEIASLRSQLSVISSLRSSLDILSSGSAHQSSAIGGLLTARKINLSLDQSEKTCNSTPLLSDSLMDIVKMDIEMMDTSTANFQPDILSALQTTTQTVDSVSESPYIQVHQSVAISTSHEGENIKYNSLLFFYINLIYNFTFSFKRELETYACETHDRQRLTSKFHQLMRRYILNRDSAICQRIAQTSCPHKQKTLLLVAF